MSLLFCLGKNLPKLSSGKIRNLRQPIHKNSQPSLSCVIKMPGNRVKKLSVFQ